MGVTMKMQIVTVMQMMLKTNDDTDESDNDEDNDDDDNDDEEQETSIPFSDWVGVSGVDFYEDTIRTAHIAAPAAIGTQCFIFPVCHDQHLYGKILEIQKVRRSMEPELTDTVIRDLLRHETKALQAASGVLRLPKKTKPKPTHAASVTDTKMAAAAAAKKKAATADGTAGSDTELGTMLAGGGGTKEEENEEPEDGGEDGSENEQDENTEKMKQPTWPGLDQLLPMHTTRDF